MGAPRTCPVTDTPQIDDHRRFKELWKELVFARLATAAGLGLVCGVVLLWVGFAESIPTLVLIMLMLAVPSAAATRGALVVPAIMAAVLSGWYVMQLGHWLFGMTWQAAVSGPGYESVSEVLAPISPIESSAVVASAIGVVEGLFRRSTATIFGGLLGGMASGAAAGALQPGVGGMGELTKAFLLPLLLFVTIHLGIGLSLALGRWIRDLPKRGASSPPAAG